MKCYFCAKEGKDKDAVAICIICGLGVCNEHLVREELPRWKGEYPLPSKYMPKTLPRILCRDCYEALKETLW